MLLTVSKHNVYIDFIHDLICVYIYIFMSLYIFIYLYVFIYIYISLCIYIYLYVILSIVLIISNHHRFNNEIINMKLSNLLWSSYLFNICLIAV